MLSNLYSKNIASHDHSRNSQLLILIADKNENILNFLFRELKSDYAVIAVSDIETAYFQAFKEIPDIVICDLMLPDLCAIEFMRTLKNKEITCHIPIILLIDEDSEKSISESIKREADAYVMKPFNISNLKARIMNLNQSRQLLRDEFLKQAGLFVEKKTHSKVDEQFLSELSQVIGGFMHDHQFDGDLLATHFGLSKSHLSRKIKDLTGLSIGDLIRIERLKKAADLLLKSSYQVSEIAEIVGFNSFSYFSKSFKEFYGLTPSHYKQML